MMEQVLIEHFDIPITVTPNLGRWHMLAPDQIARLGKQNTKLNGGWVLGPRMWRRDLTVGLRLGPLNRSQHDHFLKDGPGAIALRHMLQMFDTPTLRYEVELVLRAADVRPARLSATGGFRLGMNCMLRTRAVPTDWAQTRYLIKIE
jgi:type VI secretion system protein ImpH